MAIQSIEYRVVPHYEAALYEAGADSDRWEKVLDARILPEGVGPVVWKNRPEDTTTGEYSRDGVIRDALLVWYDEADAVAAWLFDLNATDLQDTVAAFSAAYGGDMAAMKSNRPAA